MSPVVCVSEFEKRNQIVEIGHSFGELYGLVLVAGFEHRLALLQADVGCVASSGEVASELSRAVRTAALLEQLGHLPDQAFGFESCHITQFSVTLMRIAIAVIAPARRQIWQKLCLRCFRNKQRNQSLWLHFVELHLIGYL